MTQRPESDVKLGRELAKSAEGWTARERRQHAELQLVGAQRALASETWDAADMSAELEDTFVYCCACLVRSRCCGGPSAKHAYLAGANTPRLTLDLEVVHGYAKKTFGSPDPHDRSRYCGGAPMENAELTAVAQSKAT